MTDLFDVVQYFEDGFWERVRESVTAAESVVAARHFSASVGAQLGTTRRVMIIDGDDYVVFEWRYGEGVVFPTREQCATVAAETGDELVIDVPDGHKP